MGVLAAGKVAEGATIHVTLSQTAHLHWKTVE
jgi:hypothetical protein